MSENKYGNLLDKYMGGGEKKDYSGMLQKEEKKYKGTENDSASVSRFSTN